MTIRLLTTKDVQTVLAESGYHGPEITSARYSCDALGIAIYDCRVESGRLTAYIAEDLSGRLVARYLVQEPA